MTFLHLNPPELPDWSTFFSQVVVADLSGAKVVFVSGQVGVNREQKVPGNGSLEEQFDQALSNLTVALRAAKAELAHVTALTIYVVGYVPEKTTILRNVLARHFSSRMLPTCTLVGVASLARPEFHVEVQAIAVVRMAGD